MSKNAKNSVSTSQKTIRVLETLKELDGARVTELANALDMNKSTVHNHLSTLEEEELVVKDGSEYTLGLRLLEFGGSARNQHPLYRAALPEIERLAAQTGELANLTVEEHGRGIYLACEQGERAIDINVFPGLRRPLHLTASGKAILAYLPNERVDKIIDRHGLEPATPQSVTDRGELESRLETVRERSFAVDDEELIEGLRCVAAPIQDLDGGVLGAISVAAPANRMEDDRFLDETPDMVRSTANVIELTINHS